MKTNAVHSIGPDIAGRLHVPHQSRHVPPEAWGPYPGPIPDGWKAMADAKGFRITARIRDRLHIALECKACGSLTAHKIFTLRTALPRCGGCAEAGMIDMALRAGLVFLRRDRFAHHYALYRAECGHVVRRQFAFIERVADGRTDLRCEHCLIAREQAEARVQGWERLGRDRKGNLSYRLYRHSCGNIQRIARVNMMWGQCKCARCGGAWNAMASFIYLIAITVPDTDLRVLKLGFSKHPVKRFRHQLGLPATAEVEPLRILKIGTGHDACTLETAAHATLRRNVPAEVVPFGVYAGTINTKSEIYRPSALGEIMRLMDRIESAQSGITALPGV